MSELQTREFMLGLAALFGLSYLLAGALARVRIPGVLGALLVAMLAQNTPLGVYLLRSEYLPVFEFLGQLGILFLLFYVGLQIDLKEMLGLGGDIVALTVIKIVLVGVAVSAIMLWMGYGWVLSLVISMILIPTAEAVIIPILDEFRLIRTRMGEIIIGSSVLDDIVEIFMVALVSIWIGIGDAPTSFSAERLPVCVLQALAFIVLVAVTFRWLAKWLSRLAPRRTSNLILLAMVILFGFAGISASVGLGIVAGAICAGLVTRPAFDGLGHTGEMARHDIKSISYGFLAPVFFFWVGLHVDVWGLAKAPELTLVLLGGALLAKVSSVMVMVPFKRVTLHEGWLIGISVNAGLTTEIIVAQLMFDARLIDAGLFSALVAVSSISTICVPLLLSTLLRRWQDNGLHLREA
ncbi:MAG: cation:proton antiporter [Methylococcaceae bacterium]|nr:MAG: cation:proton antiporter [Methylococcaceae bacterium]